jgi:hypothetical protein
MAIFEHSFYIKATENLKKSASDGIDNSVCRVGRKIKFCRKAFMRSIKKRVDYS